MLRRFLLITIAVLACGCGGSGAKELMCDQVVAAFKAAGLEAEGVTVMETADYGIVPKLATEGKRFLVPSLGDDSGGRIMVFKSTADRDKVKAAYDAMGAESAMLFSWVFVRDNVLVQINGSLPEAQAKAYEAALLGME